MSKLSILTLLIVFLTSTSNAVINNGGSSGGGGSVAGSDKQVQYNGSGSFAAGSDLVFDYNNGRLGIDQSSPQAIIHTIGGTTVGTIGSNAIVLGNLNATAAIGNNAFVAGGSNLSPGNTASGVGAISMGRDSVVTGQTATGFGQSGTASGIASLVLGQSNTASGTATIGGGNTSTASGEFSMTQGIGLTAQGYGQTALGTYNIAQGTSGSIVSGDSLFIVGNGTSGGAKANAFAVLNTGEARYYGSTSNYVGIKSPASPTAHTIILPSVAGAGGDILYYNGADTLAPLINGTSGQYLKSNGASAPTWTTVAGSDIQTEIWLDNVGTSAGFSNNTRLYTNITAGHNNGGSDLTYTAASGTITVNTSGTYCVIVADHGPTPGENYGPVMNVASATSFNSTTITQRLGLCTVYLVNYLSQCGSCSIIPATTAITVQSSSTGLNANDAYSFFRITRVQ